jgi:hypothetical protein
MEAALDPRTTERLVKENQEPQRPGRPSGECLLPFGPILQASAIPVNSRDTLYLKLILRGDHFDVSFLGRCISS